MKMTIVSMVKTMLLAVSIMSSFCGAFAAGLPPLAQQAAVTGKVTSAKEGVALPGVTVQVKGGEQGTQTDIHGNFSIQVPGEDVTLVFSFLGFVTKEVELDGMLRLEVELEEDIEALSEVIVTVPYGTETRASFTGSATTINTEALSDRPRSTFQTSLQGNVAGLQVMEPTGQPGAAPVVRIRGISSFSGINTPLYVIDGVPMLTQSVAGLAESSNTGAGVNPNDIESVTVLKDASATSIYGSQGANGVILITTKQGKAGKTKIDFTANYGVNTMATTKRNKPLNTAEMTELLVEGVINNTTGDFAGITTPEAASRYLIGEGLNPDVNTDWFDVITQTGKYEQYNLAASGGNEKTKFYLSGGYYKQDAVTKGQGYDRKTGRITLSHDASDRLSFNGRLSATHQNLSTVPGGGAGQNPVRSLYRFAPWLAPYTQDGAYNPLITHNPELLRHENRYETRIFQGSGNIDASFKIIEPLSVESKAGFELFYTDDYRYWSPNWRDGLGSNGRGMEYSRTWDNWTLNNLLKYQDEFGDFGINATLGQEAGKRNLKSVSTQANNFVGEGLYTLANTSEPYIAWSSKSTATIVSYFLNTSINYQRKYYLNATVRRDGSSRFGRNVRYGNFWSVGGAWNIHEETFMEGSGIVNQLKLRASYGTSGSQLGSYYGVLGYYSSGQNYMEEPGFAIGQLENGDLRWEKNKPFDIGIEFSLFSDRLSGTVDWYTRRTSDLFQDLPVSHTNGVTNINFNVGGMKNYGAEVTLSSQNMVAGEPGGFEWRTDFNITTQKNKITELVEDRTASGYYMRRIGGDYYQYFLRGYAGVDPETGEALWYTNSTRSATTNDYSEASPFIQEGKSALARFFGGLTNTFSYKGLSLSALIYFNWGGYIYDGWGTYTHSDGSARLSEAGLISRMVYEHRWQQPGDQAEYPKIVYGGSQSGGNSQHSTRFLYNGSYIRLRDVTLTYELPVRKLGLPMSRASLFLRGNNLYTYVHDKLLPYDPEVNITGVLDQNLPISRQYVLGVNVTF